MKGILLGLLVLLGLQGLGQSIGYLRYDSTIVMKQGGFNELVIRNRTKDTLGFLYNTGNGVTAFRRVKQINDTTFVMGSDTVLIKSAASGGSGLNTLNGLNAGLQTFATPGVAGSVPNWVSGGSAHTLNIPRAQDPGVVLGLVSKTNYDAWQAKIGPSDTASMLANYLNAGDTLSLSNRIDAIKANGITATIGDVFTSGTSPEGVAITNLIATGVTAGTYTNATITVDNKGRLLFAASGSGGGGTGTDNVNGGSGYRLVTSGQVIRTLFSTTGITIDSTSNVAGLTIKPDTSVLATQYDLSQVAAGAGTGITALTGDVTASGPGSSAATIANDAVTFAKLQNIPTASLIGRYSASTGDAQSITLGTGLTLSAGGVLSASSGTSYTFNGPLSEAAGAVSIANAAADGTTKGAASFAASDFNSNTGNITIDYANGQASGPGAKGFLTATDWTTFNNKQASGNYITALTGDATASGPGSAALTLATVNGAPGTFAWPSSVTVNGKGLVTAVTAGTIDATPTDGSNNPVASNGVFDALATKQGTLNLTTTGTSGAATLIGSTLNIPQYAGVTYTAGYGLALTGNAFRVDTATIFNPYLTAINARVKYSDTSSMLTAYRNALNIKLENISNYITPGTNVTFSGSGTLADPYVVNAAGSGGTGGTDNGMVGTGYRPLYLGTQNLRTYVGTTGLTIDSTSNPSSLTFRVDTASIFGSLTTAINARVKYSDTTSMLAAYRTAIGAKQNALTLTTTGTSGPATLTGATLNIPQYAGTTYTAGTRLTLVGSQFNVDTLNLLAPYQAAINARLQNITGLITAGTNVSVTGAGTSGSPYVINATAGGSGTVNSGVINTLAYYPANGTAVDDLPAITASRLLVSNGNGLPVASPVTATEAGYLSGVTSAIQTQLNGKQATLSLTTTGTSGAATLVGSTLNIPQYAGASYTAGTRLTLVGNQFNVDTLNLLAPYQTAINQRLQNVTNYITAGSNVTITGAGTLASPYVINSAGSGGGGSYTGTADRISISGTTIDIASTYVGQTSLTTLGTIGTGTWQGTKIAAAYGGVPPGGSTGWILAKTSNADNAVGWIPPPTGASYFSGYGVSIDGENNISIDTASLSNKYVLRGAITAGTNISITGSGTGASPYVINATGGSSNTFTANDFDVSGSNVSLDYVNAQKASSALSGFLSSTDWNTFNNKQALLVSGTNIKTVNGSSLLGAGDLTVNGNTVFAPELVFNQGTGTIVIPDAAETNLIMQPNGTTADNWYREVNNGDPLTDDKNIYYITANNGLLNNWNLPGTLTDVQGFFPTVFKIGTTYYMFIKQNGASPAHFHNGDIYLYQSTNKVNWTVMNGGAPAITHSSTTTDWRNRLYNVGVAVVGSTIHVLVEGLASTGSLATPHPAMMGYASANISSPIFTLPATPQFQNGYNPDLIYVPEKNSLLVGYNTLYYFDTYYKSYLQFAKASLSTNLNYSEAWNISPYYATSLSDTANDGPAYPSDFSIAETPGKTFPMTMTYNYNQSQGYQAYMPLVNTYLELFESIPDYTSSIATLSSGGSSSGGQWVTSGANIYNSNTGNVVIGATTGTDKLTVVTNANSSQNISIKNNSTGTNAQANFAAYNNLGYGGGMGITGSGYSSYGALTANKAYIYSGVSQVYMADAGDGTISWATGGNTMRLQLKADGTLNYPILAGVGERPLAVNSAGDIVLSTGGGGSSQWSNISSGISYTNTANANREALVINASLGASAQASLSASNGTSGVSFGITGTGYATYGNLQASNAYIYTGSDIALVSDGGAIKFSTSGAVERMRITASGVNINTPGSDYTLPIGRPAADGYVLTGNTNGTTSWTAASGGSNYFTAISSGILRTDNAASAKEIQMLNNSTGTGAQASFTASNGSAAVSFGMTGVNYTPYGALSGSEAVIYTGAPVVMMSDNTSGYISFAGSGNVETARFASESSLHYLNFGGASGAAGYGFRNNGGVMEFKNSGGSWAAFGSGGGGLTAVSGGTTGLTFTGTSTATMSGILSKANGGTGTSTPNLTAGTGIGITGTWPNQTITNTYAATAPQAASFYANSTGSASGSFTGSIAVADGEAGHFEVHMDIATADNSTSYSRVSYIPFKRISGVLTFGSEYEVYVSGMGAYPWNSLYSYSNVSGNLGMTYSTNGGPIAWTARVIKYVSSYAL